MASIKTYLTKAGEKRYSIHLYGGTNPQTGKPVKIHRRGFKTKKEATLMASRLELEIQNGGINKEKHILFCDVYSEWYETYIHTVKESTALRVPKMFDNHILPAFGNKRIKTITARNVQQAVNQWFDEVKVNYRKWYHYTNMVFKFALQRGYIQKNPVNVVTLPQHKGEWEDDRNNYWTKEELSRFFSYIDPETELEKFTLFRVLAFTGIRRGECLALTWGDVDFDKHALDINKTVAQGQNGKQIIQTPKTARGKRVITLDSVTIDLLKRWQAKQKEQYTILGFNTSKPKQLVFANTKNGLKSLNTPGKWLHSIIDDRPKEFTPITIHKFRHTHATMMLESGATIKEVQSRLGDADIDVILNVYSHVTENKERETAEKLANYITE